MKVAERPKSWKKQSAMEAFTNADGPIELMEIKPGLQQEFENIMDVVQAIGFGVSVLITGYIALRETRHRNAEATQRAQEEAKKRQAEHELAMVQEHEPALLPRRPRPVPARGHEGGARRRRRGVRRQSPAGGRVGVGASGRWTSRLAGPGGEEVPVALGARPLT